MQCSNKNIQTQEIEKKNSLMIQFLQTDFFHPMENSKPNFMHKQTHVKNFHG